MAGCVSALQLRARAAKARVADPRYPGLNPYPRPFQYERASYRRAVVCHYCMVHIEDPRLTIVLQWLNFSSRA